MSRNKFILRVDLGLDNTYSLLALRGVLGGELVGDTVVALAYLRFILDESLVTRMLYVLNPIY